MDLDLRGYRALVGGASQGIGKACCEELAMLGASVIALSRRKSQLEDVVTRLDTKKGQQHDFIALDLLDKEQLKEAILHQLERSSIDIVINNTAGPKPGKIIDAHDNEFVQGVESHLLANQLMAKLTLPGMRKKQFGRIINITSTSVKVPIAGLGVSNTIRAAVAAWAKTLAMEVASDGITVNTIMPGFTKTPRLENIISAKACENNSTKEAVTSAMKSQIPQGRFANPEEIAAACAFLATPAASYINGVALAVDGGRTGCL